MTTIDLLASAALQLATVVAAVWALTESIGNKVPRFNKVFLSFILGPLLATGAFIFGFFPMINELALPSRPLRIGAAAFAGFICTATAKLIHDNLINPFLLKRKNGGI